jgi:hypothetical protein
MVEQNANTFKDAPRGARVVKAFSKQQSYCEGTRDQAHTVPASCWVDLGFEYDAIDVATVLTTWPFVAVAMTVDGEAIGNPKKQSKGPYEISLTCASETHVGYAMANSLYLPPLPVGDHLITWTITFGQEVDDGWNVHPKGEVLEFTSRLHVVKQA